MYRRGSPPFSYWLKLCFLPPHSPAAADGAQGWHWAKQPRTISSFHWWWITQVCCFLSYNHSSPLFIPLFLPRLLFILMWSGWSSWWWHRVDYAVPTVTYSKAAGEGAIVASDLWMTALPVAPAPHWRAHGERACVQGRVHYNSGWFRNGLLKWYTDTRILGMSLIITSVFGTILIYNISVITCCIWSLWVWFRNRIKVYYNSQATYW